MTAALNWDDLELPIIPYISFGMVFDNWEAWAADSKHPRHVEAQKLLKRVERCPELRQPIRDLTLLDTYADEIGLILSDLFPESLQKNEIKAAVLPFQPVMFNATERFANLIKNAGEGFDLRLRGMDDDYYYMIAASFYLKMRYNVPIDLARPQLFDIPDLVNGTVRTYRAFFNADFSNVTARKDVPTLTTEEVDQLLGNADDVDLWKKLIPPNSYEYHGFGLMTLFDVSKDQALSDLKTLLIRREALMNATELEKLETSLGTYLGVADLRLGLAALHNDDLIASPQEQWSSVMLENKKHMDCSTAFCSYSHEVLLVDAKPMLVTDTEHYKESKMPLMQRMIEEGVRSFIAAPLVDDEKVIGILEVRSAQPAVINSVSEQKLQEVTALFSVALDRALKEYENQVEAIIKEKCTAVHPSVEWRFFDAATRLLEKTENYHEAEMEEIVFDRVYPLFGQLDIKGSSTYRDKTIQADLISQLKLARRVFEEALEQDALVMYEQLIYEIDLNLERLADRLDSGEENAITSFFRETVSPALAHLRTIGTVNKALVEYDRRLDPKLNVIYEERKMYEETVATINEHLGSYLEGAQRKAQEIFPHYFEKFKTDGVEYNMYIGQSLVKGEGYNEIYLQNLRLWQLVVTCELENLIQRVQDTFAIPLTVASLIMVQDTPLDIRFRYDEKRFDVDGAYNARYEIIKKRIDKAHIKGTNDRLTQPGKIAIVFSSPGERKEYERYIRFLIQREYITDVVEYVELEDLPGATGLQAVQLNINYMPDKLDQYLSHKIERILEEVESEV